MSSGVIHAELFVMSALVVQLMDGRATAMFAQIHCSLNAH